MRKRGTLAALQSWQLGISKMEGSVVCAPREELIDILMRMPDEQKPNLDLGEHACMDEPGDIHEYQFGLVRADVGKLCIHHIWGRKLELLIVLLQSSNVGVQNVHKLIGISGNVRRMEIAETTHISMCDPTMGCS
jgi:hypothetical protein